MMEQPVRRLMAWYFAAYFAVAVGQFCFFAFFRSFEWGFFLAALLWIAGLLWIADRLPERKAWWMLTAAGLLFKMLWIVFVLTPAVSDYKLMYNTAREIVEGSRAYLDNIYFRRFPYQLGFTAYQALVLSVVDSIGVLKLLNALWGAVTSLCVYGIAREAFSRKVAVAAMLLHITLLPLLLMSSVLTNQHIGVALLYVGIYVWIKRGGTWPGAAAAGAILALGNVMRPIGIVVVAAVVVNAGMHWLRRPSRPALFGILRAGGAAGTYAAVFAIISLLFSYTGLSPDGLRNNDPLWKFVVGLNAEQNGTYSTADERLLNYGYMEPQKRTELELAIIRERLTSVRNLVKLPFVKIGKLWADYQPDWFTFPKKSGTTFHYLGWPVSFDDAIERYRMFERAVFYFLAAAAFWGILRFTASQDPSDAKRLLMLIFGAYTFVHLLVEVQPRYLYFLFGILVMFSADVLLTVRGRLGRIAAMIPGPHGPHRAQDHPFRQQPDREEHA
jgi:hypothetical protein